jgi:type IV pilus assembly protein PilB
VQEGFTHEDVHGGLRIYGPVGCKSCTDGYKGRTGIYQVMPVTEALSRIILEGGSAQALAEQAKQEGIWDLRRSALQKVKDGVTSLEEINRVTID